MNGACHIRSSIATSTIADVADCIKLTSITNHNFLGAFVCPNKTNAPLVVYTNCVLAFAIPAETLKTISGRHREVCKFFGGVQLQELPKSDSSDVPETLRSFTNPQLFGLLVCKRKDHPSESRYLSISNLMDNISSAIIR
jgi:hypothetical protein